MKLHLGVIDVPEPYDSKTTGAVGEELEKNYKLFSSFYEYRKKEITNLIAEDAAIGIERLLKGEDVTIGDTFAVSGEEITDEMHKFVTSKDAEIYGKAAPPLTIPTLAAQAGTSYRFNKGFTAKRHVKGLAGKGKETITGNPRPSFIYSGVFEASLKGWIE